MVDETEENPVIASRVVDDDDDDDDDDDSDDSSSYYSDSDDEEPQLADDDDNGWKKLVVSAKKKKMDKSGDSPLLTAIRGSDNVERMKEIIANWSEVVKAANTKTNATPLYIATKFNRVNVAKFLLNAWPEAVNVKRSDNNQTPFHVCCKLELLQALLDVSDSKDTVLGSLDSSGNTPLHIILGRSNIDSQELLKLVQFYVHHNPQIIKIGNCRGETPLFHALLETILPLEGIFEMIDACPDAVKIATSYGHTCLSPFALRYGIKYFSRVLKLWDGKSLTGKFFKEAARTVHSALHDKEFDVVKLFIDKEPKLLSERIPDGIGGVSEFLTTIHLAIQRAAPLELIQDMIDHMELEIIYDDHSNVLAFAMDNQADSKILSLLLDNFKNGCEKRTTFNEDYPLHLAARYYTHDIELVKRIRDSFPEAAFIANCDGCLPYHCLEDGCSDEIYDMILQPLLDTPAQVTVSINAAAYQSYKASPLVLLLEGKGTTLQHFQKVYGAFVNTSQKKAASLKYLLEEIGLVAIRHDNPMDVISFVFEKWPDSINCTGVLHEAVQRKSDFEFIKGIYDANPDTVLELYKGESVLHYLIRVGNFDKGEDRYNILELLLNHDMAVCLLRNKDGNIPIFDALEYNSPTRVVQRLVDTCLKSLYTESQDGLLPLHFAVSKKLSFDVTKILFDKNPSATAVLDPNGKSAATSLAAKISRSNRMDYDAVRKLRLLVKGLRDGRSLNLTNSISIFAVCSFFCFFDDSLEFPQEDNKMNDYDSEDDDDVLLNGSDQDNLELPVPSINFNQEYIPGWTPLETIVDFEKEESSELFFQIEEKLRTSIRDKDIMIPINIGGNEFVVKSTEKILDTTMEEIADRAKLSNVVKLKEWGETYGRFLKKYRIEADKDPKHRSSTCVVLFGTESRNGKESQVALKFMSDDAAFVREINKRKGKVSALDSVVKIIASYSSAQSDDANMIDICNEKNVHFGINMQRELRWHKNIYLNKSTSGNVDTSPPKIKHLIVMECGSGLDLSDIVSHQDVAGRNLPIVLHAAIGIAKNLQTLNETCGILHGDVKPRNFISLGVGAGYIAIDLDNAATIGQEEAGKKRTSSGYLPPEQAEIEYARRMIDSADNNGTTVDDFKSQAIKKLKAIAAEKANALMEVDVTDNDKFHAAIEDLKKTREQLKQLAMDEFSAPSKSVVASSQYDMWCFGVLLYQLCTNETLFRYDGREEVDMNELVKIREWNDDMCNERLKVVPKDWPRDVLQDLLQKDPVCRPKSWDYIIMELRKYFGNVDLKGMAGDIQTNAALIKENTTLVEQGNLLLAGHTAMLLDLKQRIDNIPDVLVQIENVNCPYLFKVIDEEEYERQMAELAAANNEGDDDIVANIEHALDRAQSLMDDAIEMVDTVKTLLDTPNKKIRRRGIFKHAFKKAVKSEEVVYLQLLCGWTLAPVVTYEVNVVKYHEQIKQAAVFGAKMCAVGLKVSVLWNTGASGARMFGYPVPNIPTKMIEQAQELLERVNDSAGHDEFFATGQDSGFNIEELNEFGDLLSELEGKGKMCRMFEEQEGLEGKSWKDVMIPEIVELSGQKQITYISARESKRLGGASYQESMTSGA